MTTRYVDNDASGADNGTSWTHAYQTIQQAIDNVAAGDIVYCRHSSSSQETLGAALAWDGTSGDETSGMVQFIGCNSSGTNDGTRYVIDGSSQTYTNAADATDFWHLENLEFKQMSGPGFGGTNSPDRFVFINCSFNNNATYGVDCTQLQFGTFYRCTSYENGSDGLNKGAGIELFFCSFHSNTGYGLNAGGTWGTTIMSGCLVYDNGDMGLYQISDGAVIINSVIDGNATGGIKLHGASGDLITHLIGNRITNHNTASDIGVDASGSIIYRGWNYYQDNDSDNVQNAGLVLHIRDDGSNTDVEDQGDTDEGYTDLTGGAEDFNLTSSATSRRTAITIPTT